MANATFTARLRLKYDTYQNWTTNNPVLLQGEAAVCVIPASTGAVQQEPVTLIKIGDGTKHFNELEFIGAKAADVYDWAKAATKPTYKASEIAGLADYISGQIQDTDTQYQLVKVDNYNYKLQSKAKGSDTWTDVSTLTIPQDTLESGSVNGTVAFNGANVAVKGLGSAAYTDSTAYDAAGAATNVHDTLLGSSSDDATKNTIYGAKAAAAAASSAAATAQSTAEAAQTAADNAQNSANTANTGVSDLNTKIGTVADGKTVVKMIEDAQAAAEKVANDNNIAMDTRMKAAESAISTLNGDGEGSVSKAVSDGIASVVAGAPESLDTLKEISDWIGGHAESAATMNSQITDNKNAITTLNGDSSVTGSVDQKVSDAVTAAKNTLQANIDKKVDKVEGKGLSTNDYTTEEKNKLAGIAEGAQVNVIETIKVNGVAQAVTSKTVDIDVPTGALAEKDKVAEADLETALATKINGKVDIASCGNIISHNAEDFAVADHNHDDVYSKLGHTHKIDDLDQTSYIIFDCGTSSTVI